MLQLFPDTAQEPGSFTFIDLFAGIGGVRLGLSRVGGRCVYSWDTTPLAGCPICGRTDLPFG